METNEATWTIKAGTEVRTIYGETATILVDWFNWECSVTVLTTSGRTERYHPTKVFRNHKPLPYLP